MVHPSTISKLSDDLLEAIFITCVHGAEVSPVTLTHVCRLWRDVGHRSARLWTDIDLASPEKAKHFFELSQSAPLRVVWFNRSYGVVTTSTRDWIWPHANRFLELELISPSKVVDHIVTRMGDNLKVLLSWTIIAEDASQILRVPIHLRLIMPCLRYLQLLNIQTYAEDLLQIIKSSPLLEAIEVFQVAFLDAGSGGRAALTPLEGACISPPRLLRLNLMSIGTIAQAYILTRLRLPVHCALLISEPSSTLGWDAVLHPSVAAHLRYLSFTSFRFHPRYIELSRGPHKGQHGLTVIVIPTGRIDAFMAFDRFDMSQMHTIEIDNTADPELRSYLETLFENVRTVEVVTLKKRTALEILPRACQTLPQLRELRLVDIDMDNSSPWNSDMRLADGISDLLKRRGEDGTDEFRPIDRVALRNCSCSPNSLGILQSRAEVIFE
ncbi:hypothetical protein NM688_g6783 [Phlebia brevispora]|uniref:Uncharacterized protein n=1 Tax=Phlebia brevispora TaxID=194682 RepID=A0ACC1SCV7_9APHY|nr:hypothetical protein NM688_g6783 [Phlebia brevispora]